MRLEDPWSMALSQLAALAMVPHFVVSAYWWLILHTGVVTQLTPLLQSMFYMSVVSSQASYTSHPLGYLLSTFNVYPHKDIVWEVCGSPSWQLEGFTYLPQEAKASHSTGWKWLQIAFFCFVSDHIFIHEYVWSQCWDLWNGRDQITAHKHVIHNNNRYL